jgi:hypothetical protein
MLLSSLPGGLTAEAIIKRRAKACERKDQWRSTYREAFDFACPQRESFTWRTPGQAKDKHLYEGTLQEATYQASNTMLSLLLPQWQRWAQLTPGDMWGVDEVPQDVEVGLQKATEMFFGFLNHSNFYSVIGEICTDLMIGTAALSFEESDDYDSPFQFQAIPVSAIEIEEGPTGTVETAFVARKIAARNVQRTFQGLEETAVPVKIRELVVSKPDEEVEIVQAEIYIPAARKYIGVALYEKEAFWIWDYGTSCPTIVARANKNSGETYGRGRVLLALRDAKTLNTMQEFVLRQAALQVAPPSKAVSDGILNPYTAQLVPNAIIPMMDTDNLQVIEVGGNFAVSETLMNELRQRIRRTMLGPDASDSGPIKSATEISIADRNRLWSMGGEFIRVQNELVAKIVKRGVYIMQRRQLIPEFKIDGKEVGVTWTSPFAQSQSSKDVIALQTVLQLGGSLGPALLRGVKLEDAPAWLARKAGLDAKLIRSADEVATFDKKAGAAAAAHMAAQGGQPAPAATPAAAA